MKFELKERHQMNPHYDERFKNNGGGYDQPLFVYSAGEYTLEISDENAGDFGNEYSVTLFKNGTIIAYYHYCNKENDCRNKEWSSFYSEVKEHVEAAEFSASCGYPVRFIEIFWTSD